MINYKDLGLVNTREMFARAIKGGYAIPAFNFNNMEQLQAIIKAASAKKSPVILQVSKGARAYANQTLLRYMAEGAVEYAKELGCKHPEIVLHLDHGDSFETCKSCIDMGFSSVMIDGSGLPYEENVALTKKVVDYAHQFDVTVEGELGVLAGVEDEVSHAESHYTKPEEVVDFATRTGCDSLAISIGTSHGAYKFTPEQCTVDPKTGRLVPPPLAFDVLDAVMKELPGFPIVLHGSSSVPQEEVDTINKYGGKLPNAVGIPEEQLRKAAASAVCKINIDSPKVMHDNSLTKDVLNYTDDDKFDVVLMNPPYGGSEKNDIKQHFPSDLSSSETADLFMVLIMYRLAKNGRAAVILPDGFLFGTDNAKLAIKEKLLREFNLHTVIRLPGSIFAPYTPIATNILFFNNERAEGAEEGFCTNATWFYRLDMPEGYKHFSKTKPMRAEHCEPIIAWWNNRQEIADTESNDEKSRRFTARQLLELDCNFDQCKFPKDEEEILPPAELLADYFKKRKALDHEIDKTLAEIQRILGIEISKEEQ